MNYVGSKDYLEVYGASLFSNVDFDVVTRLYQPIIGYKAAMLYFTLVNYINLNEGDFLNHENVFHIMQISPSDFLLARKALEACGLVRTYLKIENDCKKYTYVLYAPLSPHDFFQDALFKGTLVRYIGEKEATKLALHYRCHFDKDSGSDISSSFNDVFNPELNDPSFDAELPLFLKDNKPLKIRSNFSREKFFEHLKAYMILDSAFSNKECDEIERLATLYGLDVITMADIVMDSFNEKNRKGSRVDFSHLKERAISEAKYATINRKVTQGKTFVRISGKTKLVDEIELMSQASPKNYLQSKQDGVPPVTSDLRLIGYLSETMGLNNATINALIYYCLQKCDNRLERNYVEKVASSLRREKITSAIDALNYLEQKKNNTKPLKIDSVNKPKTDEKDDDDFNAEEWKKLVSM